MIIERMPIDEWGAVENKNQDMRAPTLQFIVTVKEIRMMRTQEKNNPTVHYTLSEELTMYLEDIGEWKREKCKDHNAPIKHCESLQVEHA